MANTATLTKTLFACMPGGGAFCDQGTRLDTPDINLPLPKAEHGVAAAAAACVIMPHLEDGAALLLPLRRSRIKHQAVAPLHWLLKGQPIHCVAHLSQHPWPSAILGRSSASARMCLSSNAAISMRLPAAFRWTGYLERDGDGA